MIDPFSAAAMAGIAGGTGLLHIPAAVIVGAASAAAGGAAVVVAMAAMTATYADPNEAFRPKSDTTFTEGGEGAVPGVPT